jgi:hypothetical protein
VLITILKCSPCLHNTENSLADQQQNYISEKYIHDDPYESFLYALKAPESKRQYPKRLKVVFDYLISINELKETQLDNQCKVVSKTLQNPQWLTSGLMKFIMYQKERIRRKEIVAITAYNYLRSLKLFIDMNFDTPPINWKKITRGLPTRSEVITGDKNKDGNRVIKLIKLSFSNVQETSSTSSTSSNEDKLSTKVDQNLDDFIKDNDGTSSKTSSTENSQIQAHIFGSGRFDDPDDLSTNEFRDEKYRREQEEIAKWNH